MTDTRTYAEGNYSAPMLPCPDCGYYGGQYIDGKHLCTVYDGPPCETPGCDEPTVFVHVAAPGYGCGRVCKANHYDQQLIDRIYMSVMY